MYFVVMWRGWHFLGMVDLRVIFSVTNWCIGCGCGYPCSKVPKSVFSFIYRVIACENSRPSSLPAEWRFARRHSAGSEEGRLFSQANRVKAGVNVKAVFTSLNTAFLPISRSRFKRRQIPMLFTLSTIWRFCVNFWVIFRCFGKERFFLKG